MSSDVVMYREIVASVRAKVEAVGTIAAMVNELLRLSVEYDAAVKAKAEFEASYDPPPDTSNVVALRPKEKTPNDQQRERFERMWADRKHKSREQREADSEINYRPSRIFKARLTCLKALLGMPARNLTDIALKLAIHARAEHRGWYSNEEERGTYLSSRHFLSSVICEAGKLGGLDPSIYQPHRKPAAPAPDNGPGDAA